MRNACLGELGTAFLKFGLELTRRKRACFEFGTLCGRTSKKKRGSGKMKSQLYAASPTFCGRAEGGRSHQTQVDCTKKMRATLQGDQNATAAIVLHVDVKAQDAGSAK